MTRKETGNNQNNQNENLTHEEILKVTPEPKTPPGYLNDIYHPPYHTENRKAEYPVATSSALDDLTRTLGG